MYQFLLCQLRACETRGKQSIGELDDETFGIARMDRRARHLVHTYHLHDSLVVENGSRLLPALFGRHSARQGKQHGGRARQKVIQACLVGNEPSFDAATTNTGGLANAYIGQLLKGDFTGGLLELGQETCGRELGWMYGEM